MATLQIAQPDCYIVHPDVDLASNDPKFYWQVTIRYPRPVGSIVVNVTTAVPDKKAAIEAVWAEVGIVSIDSIVMVPF